MLHADINMWTSLPDSVGYTSLSTANELMRVTVNVVDVRLVVLLVFLLLMCITAF